jgi:hypothetical protein
MTADLTFTGSETANDIARVAIEWFSRKPNSPSVTIFYENSIPKLKYEFQGGDVECVCIFRLDKMLESFYSDAEQIFAENVRAGYINATERSILLPYIAFSGMTAMIIRLIGLQAELFIETFEDTAMITAGAVLHSLVAQSEHKASLSRPASKIIQGWIDERVAASMKKKRDFLVGFMNTQPFLHIPTGAGRPPGSKKPEEQKAREAIEFAQQVQEVIARLRFEKGEKPTKTAVAKALGLGGLSLKTGVDSSLGVFNKKLKRLKLDYDELADDGLDK